jgi:cytochrome c biogenesis protein CcdA
MNQNISKYKFFIYFSVFFISLMLVFFLGVFLQSDDINRILFFGFEASANTSSVFLNFSDLLRSGISFSAGLVAVFNPCGFALLSVYFSSFLNRKKNIDYKNRPKKYFFKIYDPIYVSTIVTIGFIIVFFIFGIALSAGFYAIKSTFTYFGLIISIMLFAYGFFILSGGNIYFNKLQKIANLLDYKNTDSSKFYFIYGISYGITSLSCTLPIFMSIVFSLSNISKIEFLLRDFVLFSVGTWVALLTVSLALLFLDIIVQKIKFFLSIYKYISSLILILSGSYLILYWLSDFKI